MPKKKTPTRTKTASFDAFLQILAAAELLESPFSTGDVAAKTGLSEVTCRNWLERLMDAGIVRREADVAHRESYGGRKVRWTLEMVLAPRKRTRKKKAAA